MKATVMGTEKEVVMAKTLAVMKAPKKGKHLVYFEQ